MSRAWWWTLSLGAICALPLAAQPELTEEWGVDRHGGDYRSFRTVDVDSCKTACAQERNCRAYTFNANTSTCYLKSTPGSPRRSGGRVSGVKVASEAPPAGSGRLSEEWGYDYAGNDYETFQVANLAGCKAKCAEAPRCRAYTFNHRAETCYLKSGTGERRAHEAAVTGTKDGRNPPPEPVEPTREPGYDYPGNDYDSFAADDLDACATACRIEERCRAYSFNRRSGTCYLKERAGPRQTSPNHVAGVKAAPEREPAGGGLSEEPGYDYRGNDYHSFPARALVGCQAQCRRDPRCRAYTFNRRTGTCYLKERAGPRERNPDTVTGAKGVG